MKYFEAGEIVKTRGLRGCLKILSFLQSPEIFEDSEFIYLDDGSGKPARYHLRKADCSGKFIFAQLEGIDDVNAAQRLIGYKVLLPKELLAELPDGEYYWQDIIGLHVYDDKGQALGVVESIFPTGSNDVFVCRNDARELLIPAIDGVVLDVDLSRGAITVKLPEGL